MINSRYFFDRMYTLLVGITCWSALCQQSLIHTLSKDPVIQFFERFKRNWKEINREMYESSINNTEISHLLEQNRYETTQFIIEQLQKNHLRADYVEMLQLSLLFIGKSAHLNITVRAPGAVHCARWMAKIIYCLKIYIFRNQFKITNEKLNALRLFNIFIVKIYLKYWCYVL